MSKLLTAIIFAFVFGHNSMSQCQYLPPDPSQSFDEVVKHYFSTVEDASPLYRGLIYSDRYGINEHPFLEENGWLLGSLLYDSLYYPDVYLKYDVVSQTLLTTYNFNYAFILDDSKIQNFRIKERIFAKVVPDDPAYYEVMVCDDVSFMALRGKKIREIKEYPSIRKEYPFDDKYFILKDGTLHRIRGKKSVLDVLEDRKSQLKQFIKENEIFFAEDLRNSVTRVVSYYNSLL